MGFTEVKKHGLRDREREREQKQPPSYLALFFFFKFWVGSLSLQGFVKGSWCEWGVGSCQTAA